MLAPALTRLQGENGIQRLLDVILETTGTANGFDSIGHYLRTFLQVPVSCLPYATAQASGCQATFHQSKVSAASTVNTSAGATTASTAVGGSGQGSLADLPATTPSTPTTSGGVGAPAASGAPPSSGLLGYLLGGSGTR